MRRDFARKSTLELSERNNSSEAVVLAAEFPDSKPVKYAPVGWRVYEPHSNVPVQTLEERVHEFKLLTNFWWQTRDRTEKNLNHYFEIMPKFLKQTGLYLEMKNQTCSLERVQQIALEIYRDQTIACHSFGVLANSSDPTFWQVCSTLGFKKAMFSKIIPIQPLTVQDKRTIAKGATQPYKNTEIKINNNIAPVNGKVETVCTGFDITNHNVPICKSAMIDATLQRYRCSKFMVNRLFGVLNFTPIFPTSCTHNINKAVITRQLCWPNEDKAIPGEWRTAFKGYKERFHLDDVNYLNTYKDDISGFVARYNKNRGDQIMKARDRALESGIIPTHGKAFMKFEASFKNSLADYKPRLITAFTDQLLATNGPVMYALDKFFTKQIFTSKSDFYFTSGSTREDIGAFFSHYVGLGWSIVMNDFKTFDGSQSSECNRECNLMNIELLPNNTEADQVTSEVNMRAITCDGLYYTRDGSFGSGRIDTTHSNTNKNAAATDYVYRQLCGLTITGMFHGDDSIVFIAPNQDIPAMSVINELYSNLGLAAEANLVDNPWDAEYCSKRFWEIEPNFFYPAIKPGRALAKTFYTKNNYKDEETYKAHLRGVILGFKYDVFIPAFGAIMDWMQSAIGEGRVILDKNVEHKMNGTICIENASEFVHQQFQYYYGLDYETYKTIWLPKFQLGMEVDNDIITRLVEVDTGMIPRTNCDQL